MWLTEELKQEIKEIFEPRYKRELSNEEVLDIGNNLSGLLEATLKFKWKSENEK